MVVLDFIISIFFTVGYIIMGISFVYGWRRLDLPSGHEEIPTVKVSVLIAARNEETTIGHCLSDILAQHYPAELLEIIVVDDHSTDRTAQAVKSMGSSQITLLTLNESRALNSYKKKAIATAIDHSTGELLITTDADCRMGPDWIRTMALYYRTGEYKMISAPVAFLDDGTFFQKFQSMEFANLIGLGAAAIANGFPFTCNGANLGYSRSTFFELGGFKGIDDLASGDDELLLHKVARHYPEKIGFVKSKEAIVYTHAKKDMKEFLEQRKRWASKSVKYTNKRMIIIALTAFFFNVSIFINLILAIFFPVFRGLVASQVLVKLVLELSLMSHILRFMGQIKFLTRSIPLLPVYFFSYLCYMVFIGMAGNSGTYEWKGRIVR